MLTFVCEGSCCCYWEGPDQNFLQWASHNGQSWCYSAVLGISGEFCSLAGPHACPCVLHVVAMTANLVMYHMYAVPIIWSGAVPSPHCKGVRTTIEETKEKGSKEETGNSWGGKYLYICSCILTLELYMKPQPTLELQFLVKLFSLTLRVSYVANNLFSVHSKKFLVY